MPVPTRPDPGEIFIGLVGAIGAPLKTVAEEIQRQLQKQNYSVVPVDLMEELHELPGYEESKHSHHPTHLKLENHMNLGDRFRRETGLAHAMALLAIAGIRRIRGDTPKERTAYILRQLKRPQEVDFLREVYGDRFFLVAAYMPLAQRESALIADSIKSYKLGEKPHPDLESKVKRLIERDEEDTKVPEGQRLRETFHMADLFVDASEPATAGDQVERFVQALFGYPFHTPTKNEYAMFHAWSAACRSAALGRQVGAVVATPEGDIVSVGTNEVPKADGGQYWSDDPEDQRDFQRREDPSEKWRIAILSQMLKAMKGEGWLAKEKEVLELEDSTEQLTEIFRRHDARVVRLLEFNRTVHAEMAAITDAARRGVSTKGAALYTSTFPCHECTRHIIASGIRRVTYIEPYPKSIALDLHNDAIVVDPTKDEVERIEREGGRVGYTPFVGIAPRQYIRLFDARRIDRKKEGKVVDWRAGANDGTRFAGFSRLYIDAEDGRANELKEVKAKIVGGRNR